MPVLRFLEEEAISQQVERERGCLPEDVSS